MEAQLCSWSQLPSGKQLVMGSSTWLPPPTGKPELNAQLLSLAWFSPRCHSVSLSFKYKPGHGSFASSFPPSYPLPELSALSPASSQELTYSNYILSVTGWELARLHDWSFQPWRRFRKTKTHQQLPQKTDFMDSFLIWEKQWYHVKKKEKNKIFLSISFYFHTSSQ